MNGLGGRGVGGGHIKGGIHLIDSWHWSGTAARTGEVWGFSFYGGGRMPFTTDGNMIASTLCVRGPENSALGTPATAARTIPVAASNLPSGVAMEFVRIQPGMFTMGCSVADSQCFPDGIPAHQVTVTNRFEMGKYEVMQGQWQAVMGANPSTFKGDNLPVENVSWNDTQDFLGKLNARKDGYHYRLPTEAEWEYVARAGSKGDYPGSLDAIGWYSENSGSKTHPTGQKQPNAWGLYDMVGNVWEWVQDWYDANYYKNSPSSDPVGPTSGTSRVQRGGSWRGVSGGYTRVSDRLSSSPSYWDNYIGFRCVREAIQ